jgi:hypothetical protein
MLLFSTNYKGNTHKACKLNEMEHIGKSDESIIKTLSKLFLITIMWYINKKFTMSFSNSA